MPVVSVSTIAPADSGAPGMVVVRGELDISGVDQVRRALTDLENGPGEVSALDLREVEHLDSSGLRLLLDAEEGARRRGRRFVVIASTDGPVPRLLALTMLADHVEVVADPLALRG